MAESEAVAVGVRVRPFNDRERALKAELCIDMDGPRTTLTYKGKENTFTFDESFWSHDGFVEEGGVMVPEPGSRYADQQKVFDSFGQRVLNNAWDGFHCCLFAYGQTGAGKSYSMVGCGNNKGIVPISCEEIFRRVSANNNPNLRFEITCSMIEIYNETVQDLLILPQERPTAGLSIHESKMLGVYVEGSRKTPVQSYEAIEKVIATATEHRTIGDTLMNATSSRAHTVTTIEFKQVEVIEGKENVKLSMINLVDLAGSEKSGQTGAAGNRLKEGCAINKSLSALGNVIEKLAKRSSGKKKDKDILVPYRDSKLTRLLQNALGGSSKTIMICALSPASSNAEETLSTLRYADRAKQIKNCATVNEDPQGKLLREMKEENEKLKEMMASGGLTYSEMQKRREEISAAENALAEMQRSFAEKLREAKEVDSAMSERDRRRTWGQVMQRRLPHMVNLNEDQNLSAKLLYCFEEGKVTIIGNPNAEEDSDDEDDKEDDDDDSDEEEDDDASNSSSMANAAPDVPLNGEEIMYRHATVTNVGGVCYIQAAGDAKESTFVNGACLSQMPEPPDDKGIALDHRDRLAFGLGHQMIFVFIVPEKGAAEHVLLGNQITYQTAREELNFKRDRRMRTLGIAHVLPGAESSQGGELERYKKLCEEKDREIQELRAENARLRAQTPMAPAQHRSLPAANGMQAGHLPLHPIGEKMREAFEDAVGTLDLLEMRLTVGGKMPDKQRNLHQLYSF